MNTLGKNIKKYRMEAGMKQDELAAALGKSKNVVSNWERGDNKPDAELIEKICQLFGITPNEIYNWNEPDTLAAHRDGSIDWTADELKKIEEYKRLLLLDRVTKNQ